LKKAAAAGDTTASGAARFDAGVALIGAALLLLWDASGWDLAVVRHFGGAAGFAWRDAWLTSTLLHQGGRALGWAVMAALLLSLWRPSWQPLLRGVAPAERWRTVAAVLACLLLVPALKQFSSTSCPWDLREFGGSAVYLTHWHWGARDGGPGRCFPSGHAVAAFAFLPIYFALRRGHAGWARVWLAAICLFGALFGLAQLARGAHYVSHTLWSALLCWMIAALCDQFPMRPARAR
jgi:membrane-associated PAP2 superfamily phosphatase